MRSLILFLVCLSSAAAASADDQGNRFLVVPIDHLLTEEVIRRFFADLLRQGGLGYRQTEAAAFLVLEGESSYRCISWPFLGELHRQQFRGSVPDATIAIVHTHPEASPRPSVADAKTAITTGVPVFVLTRNNIYVALSDGTIEAVEKNRFWAPATKPERRCGGR
ncbi:MAG TPA: Mov34/MPN/PAD-1 family protein [Thermoanaerobaculia bacterium]|nr:Mov34/MPN/PAD-1 family protein [Thermoanaerobaculia bacterium]